jgi:hypothetical protein
MKTTHLSLAIPIRFYRYDCLGSNPSLRHRVDALESVSKKIETLWNVGDLWMIGNCSSDRLPSHPIRNFEYPN